MCSLMWVMSVMHIMYTVYDRWKSPRFQCAGEILDGWAGAALTAASAGQPSLRCCRSRILSVGYSILRSILLLTTIVATMLVNSARVDIFVCLWETQNTITVIAG